MKRRKPKPKTATGAKSRNIERQTLKASHLGRAESPTRKRQAPPPIDRTMRLPETIALPDPIKGAHFSYEFIRFEHAGTKARKIGAVRKAYYNLWKANDRTLKGGLIIETPANQDSVKVSHIRQEIERVRIAQDVKPAPRRLPPVGADNRTHKLAFRT